MPVQVGQTISAEDFAKLQGIKPTAHPVGTTLSASDFAKLQSPKGGAAQAPVQQPGLLQKVDEATNKVMGPASQFLFGTAAPTIGGLVGTGVENIAKGIGHPIGSTFTDQFNKQMKQHPIRSVAGTALEILPGEAIAEGVSKIPGISQAAEAIGKKLPEVLKGSAIKQYTEALAPTTQKMKLTAEKVVPQLLEKKVTALTRPGLLQKAEGGLSRAGEMLETQLEKIPPQTKVAMNSVAKALEDTKKAFTLVGPKGKQIVAEPKAIQAIDEVGKVVKQLGPNAEFDSVRRLRQIWDATVAKAKNGQGFLVDELGNFSNEAKKEATNAIRKELAKQFPDLAKANKEYTLWKGVSDVVEATMKRTAGQSAPLGRQIMTAAGAAAGLGGGVEKAATAATAFNLLSRLTSSTGWKTVSAVAKNEIAKNLAEGEIGKAMAQISKFLERITRPEDVQQKTSQ